MTDLVKVRDRLQKQYRLKVLRIYLDTSMEGKSIAIFSFTIEDGKEIARLTASMHELGLPDIRNFDEQGEVGLQESVFRIPDHILGALKYVLSDSKPVDAPLWLRLSVPLGLLPAVPWERLLQPYLNIPVLRMPHYRISPRVPAGDIDTVICFGSAVNNEADLDYQLDQFIEQVPIDLAKTTTLHLFADCTVHLALLELKRKYDSRFRINIYSPPTNLSRTTPSLQNPWLSWISSALGERCVDAVHFICDCSRVREDGALVFASSPGHKESDKKAKLLFAPELVEFLNHVGAWSVAFTSPPTDHSAAGMRMLQNTVARLRPGPTILHDMHDPDCRRALGAAYRFLFMPPQPPPASPAISLYCHPLWLTGAKIDEDSNHQLQQYTLDGKLGGRLASTSPPAWLASSQRKLEISAEELAQAEEEDPDNGRKRARELVLRTIANQAEKSLSDNPDQDTGSPV